MQSQPYLVVQSCCPLLPSRPGTKAGRKQNFIDKASMLTCNEARGYDVHSGQEMGVAGAVHLSLDSSEDVQEHLDKICEDKPFNSPAPEPVVCPLQSYLSEGSQDD